MANPSGAVVKQIDYDAFGGVSADSAPAFSLPIGFGGGIADPLTGLVRLGLRDYDPRAGRFTARDPILFEGSPMNLFEYAGSDPVNHRDPTGMVCIGFEAFQVEGGGAEFCADATGVSTCIKGGVGFGGGLDVDPGGRPRQPGVSIDAKAGLNFGPARVGVKGNFPLDKCQKTTWSVGGGVGTFELGGGNSGPYVKGRAGFDIEGNISTRSVFDTPLKFGGGASAAIRGCVSHFFG